jgi:hypothetical protein
VKKKILIAAIVVLFLILNVSVPVFASAYRYTSTHFRYIGEIYHEKTINFEHHVGSAFFWVTGKGSASGSHAVQEVKFDRSPAASVYRDTAVNIQVYMQGTTALDASNEELLLLMSMIELATQKVKMYTGVQMDPGETGFINQDVVSSVSSEGSYLRMQNHFGNTGGTTKRLLEIPGYIDEQIRVDGYAEVWDFTEMYDGKHKSGFWDMLP